MLKNCPNCGIDAIPYDKKTNPNEIVGCNNCGEKYKFKDLQKKRRNMLR